MSDEKTKEDEGRKALRQFVESRPEDFLRSFYRPTCQCSCGCDNHEEDQHMQGGDIYRSLHRNGWTITGIGVEILICGDCANGKHCEE